VGLSAVTITTVQGLCALALLYLGGEALVRGASTLALRAGISRLAVGLTVVALGTSAPELVVSVDAALTGANDIAVGNVVGSNIANIALILGLSAVLRPIAVHAKVVRLDLPIMILVSLVLVGLMADGGASRVEGAVLGFGLVAYVVFTIVESRKTSGSVPEVLGREDSSQSGAFVSAALVVSGLGLLAAGGHLLVLAAVELAGSLGVSQAAIGLTVVAVGTSLPELATGIVASMRNHGDIAVGNIVGSNIFNVLGILGVTAMIHPLRSGDVTRLDLGFMTVLACVLWILLFARSRLGRLEGVFLLASFAAYTRFVLGS
jgi:cation:H+ antiporter